jgi:hypothetical protein
MRARGSKVYCKKTRLECGRGVLDIAMAKLTKLKIAAHMSNIYTKSSQREDEERR